MQVTMLASTIPCCNALIRAADVTLLVERATDMLTLPGLPLPARVLPA
ncbi:hypothetical protein [Actinomadura decatromicini]|nr:hypothetical protein [Actinomadura decatromicini]